MAKLKALSPGDIDDLLLKQPLVAKVATHAADGTIRITPLWFAARDGGALVMNTLEDTEIVRNLKRDSRCSVLIDATGLGTTAAVHYRGTATIQERADDAGVADVIERYLGSREAAMGFAKERGSLGPRVFIHFKPEHTLSWDLRQVG